MGIHCISSFPIYIFNFYVNKNLLLVPAAAMLLQSGGTKKVAAVTEVQWLEKSLLLPRAAAEDVMEEA